MSDGMAIEKPDHDSTRNASLSVKPCPKCTRPGGALALSVEVKDAELGFGGQFKCGNL